MLLKLPISLLKNIKMEDIVEFILKLVISSTSIMFSSIIKAIPPMTLTKSCFKVQEDISQELQSSKYAKKEFLLRK